MVGLNVSSRHCIYGINVRYAYRGQWDGRIQEKNFCELSIGGINFFIFGHTLVREEKLK